VPVIFYDLRNSYNKKSIGYTNDRDIISIPMAFRGPNDIARAFNQYSIENKTLLEIDPLNKNSFTNQYSEFDNVEIQKIISQNKENCNEKETTTIKDILKTNYLNEPNFIISSDPILSNKFVADYKQKLIYSPMITFMSDKIIAADPKHNVFKDDKNVHNIDLNKILNAVSDDKTWSSIGVNINDKITLYCSPYEINNVIPLLYITLNNGKVPNISEMNELEPKVDCILNKIVAIDYFDSFLQNDKSPDIYIGPEYTLNSQDTFKEYPHLVPVYPNYSYAKTFEFISNEKYNTFDKFINDISNDSSLPNNCIIRNNTRVPTKYDYIKKDLNIVEMDDSTAAMLIGNINLEFDSNECSAKINIPNKK
jgi:hypothetical protein